MIAALVLVTSAGVAAHSTGLGLGLGRHDHQSNINTSSNNIQVLPRASSGRGYVNIPVKTVKQKVSPLTPSRRPIEARDVTLAELENREAFYAVSVFLGTPPQEIVVDIDTGSSELWVNPDCSTAQEDEVKQCEDDGHYNPKKSTTPPKGPHEGDTISYTDGSYVRLSYYNDNLSLGGDAVMPYLTFGVATATVNMSIGILGLGPDPHDGFEPRKSRHLVVDSLADQGITQSRAFSLDLRHYDDPSGSIMYGGIDRGRYTGDLEKVPLVKSSDGYWRLSVMVSGVGVTPPEGEPSLYSLDSTQGNILLDSGTTMSYLYPSYAKSILQDMGARELGRYHWAPCEMRDSPGTVDFYFGGKAIRVPYADMIRRPNVSTGEPSGYCPVAIVLTTEGGLQILGDSFLRAAYVVIDWDNQNAHLAQAASCDQEDIIPISTGTNSVPSATGLCDRPNGTGSVQVSDAGSGSSADINNYSSSNGDGEKDENHSDTVGMRARSGGLSMLVMATTGSCILIPLMIP